MKRPFWVEFIILEKKTFAVLALFVILAATVNWSIDHDTVRFNATGIVVEANYTAAHEWQENYPFFGWSHRSADDSYATMVTCSVNGDDLTLYSSRQDIYERAKGKVGSRVGIRLARLDKNHINPFTRGVDYKYALVGVE